jgi:hypothetical protein
MQIIMKRGFWFGFRNPTFSEESKRDTIEFGVIRKWNCESISKTPSGGSVFKAI